MTSCEMRSVILRTGVEVSETLSVRVCRITVTVEQAVKNVQDFCVLLKG